MADLRAVLLDLDDTLCDTHAAKRARLRRAFAGGSDPLPSWPSGLPIDRMVDEAISNNEIGPDHFPGLFARYGMDDPALAQHASEWVLANRYHGLDLFEATLETIAALRAQCAGELMLGVITNGPAEIQRPKVELLEIESLVDFTIISGEFGAWKPDPSIFYEALRLADVRPAEAIMVGDSLMHDIAGANAVGVESVWINPAGGPAPAGGPTPDHVIRTIGELPAITLRRCWR